MCNTYRLGVIVALSALVVGSLMSAVAAQAPTQGGVLTIADTYTWNELDPQKASGQNDFRVLSLAFEGLTAKTGTLEIVPCLAESWEISEDGLVYTFHLRENVAFQNGRIMTMEDVLFSFDRMLNPETASTRLSLFQDTIQSYRALDSNTLEIALGSPFSPFLAEMANRTPIIAPESVDSSNELMEWIGTGPFKLVEWTRGESLYFESHDQYWIEGVPYVDAVRVILMTDETARLAALRTGEIDYMVDFNAKDVATARSGGFGEMTVMQANDPHWYWMYINTRDPQGPLADVRVRQAIAYAIDKDDYVAAMTFGTGVPSNQAYPPGSFWYLDVEDPYRDADLDKARELLAAAGYPEGFSTNLVVASQFRMDLQAEILQSQLSKVGIEVEIEAYDWAGAMEHWRNYDYGLSVMVWVAQADPDTSYNPWVTDAGLTWAAGGYSSDLYDAILARAAQAVDPAARRAFYELALLHLQEQVPSVIQMISNDYRAVGARVKGAEDCLNIFAYSGGGVAYLWLED